MALGTNPRRGRVSTVTKGESMSWERGRSGVIHWGLGVTLPPTSTIMDEYNAKVKEEGWPSGRFHVHTYFNPVDVETRDGKTIPVVDKGHLTFLDEPDVRELAAGMAVTRRATVDPSFLLHGENGGWGQTVCPHPRSCWVSHSPTD